MTAAPIDENKVYTDDEIALALSQTENIVRKIQARRESYRADMQKSKNAINELIAMLFPDDTELQPLDNAHLPT